MQTDHALKVLMLQFSLVMTTWLTGKRIVGVEVETTSLPSLSEEIRSDMVFIATLEDGSRFVFHIEFQGVKTKIPMPRRELDYISRLSDAHPGLPILSMVLYVGKGAGSKDTGKHAILRPDGTPSIAWNYDVVHLWKMVADDVVETLPVAALALIGQMWMNNPQQVLATAVERVNEVDDAAMRKSLLQSMADLIGDKEVLKMLKTMVIPDPILGETPFMEEKRLSREEGMQEGIQKGVQIGREEGMQIGREEGVQIGREEGMQEGVQKGVQIGREEGVREGLLEGIFFVLDMKFGKNGLLLLPEIRQIQNPVHLKSLYDVLRMAKNVEDVQQEIHRLNEIDEMMNGL